MYLELVMGGIVISVILFFPPSAMCQYFFIDQERKILLLAFIWQKKLTEELKVRWEMVAGGGGRKNKKIKVSRQVWAC